MSNDHPRQIILQWLIGKRHSIQGNRVLVLNHDSTGYLGIMERGNIMRYHEKRGKLVPSSTTDVKDQAEIDFAKVCHEAGRELERSSTLLEPVSSVAAYFQVTIVYRLKRRG